jgi:hypothetical protein
MEDIDMTESGPSLEGAAGETPDGGAVLSILIRVRGHTIGHLKLNPPDAARRWTE